MSVEIREEIINGHVYMEDDRGGHLDRIFVVTGLPSDSAITESTLRANDRGKKIPGAGENHPKLPEFRVREIIIESFNKSTSQTRVVVRYVKRRRRLLDLRVTTVETYQDSYVDRTGRRMRPGWFPPQQDARTRKLVSTKPDKAFPEATQANIDAGYKYSTFSAPKQIPELLVEIIYYELSSPFNTNLKYARRVNSKAFMGRPPRTWYLQSISGVIDSPIPTNLGKLGNPRIVTGPALFDWIVTYSFRYRPSPEEQIDSEGWDPLAIYRDPNSQLVPNDIQPIDGKFPTQKRGNGWGVFQMVGEADFNDLQLVSATEEDPSNPLNQKK